jgi:diacylglycerol O-acyltransferase / wax synthase
MPSRYDRLSLADRSNLRIERPATPAHIAGLCVVAAAPLLDGDGQLDLEMIKRRLARRLVRVPMLRRIVHSAPPLGGPPLWIDDPAFSIERHVRSTAIAPPGDENSLLATTERLLSPLLDRSHPLWELWFLTGLADGRIGMLFKVHHAVADGLAAVALMMTFLDLAPDAPDPPDAPWTPMPAPSHVALLGDNMRSKALSLRSSLAHPLQLLRGVEHTLADSRQLYRLKDAAPRTSLNALPTRGRRIRVVRLDLEMARAAAHKYNAKINDVALAVVSGGVRELLITRGEPVNGVELTTSVPATLRSAEAAQRLGNAAGALLVRLPISEANAIHRLERIVVSTQAAKRAQRPAYINGVFGWLAATGLAGPIIDRQRMVNFFVTNVPGPSSPLYVLGAKIEDVAPILGLAGNVTLMFAALSYCGHLNVVVTANATAWPDIDALVAGMAQAWQELTRRPAVPLGGAQVGASSVQWTRSALSMRLER